MTRIVECVPNFSEGRDIRIINAIAGGISRVEGVKLLSAEPDRDYHRTVVTFIGAPQAVVDAAFAATRIAAEMIDMTVHRGGHPRLGAVDVVPFVPLGGAGMADAIATAHRFGKLFGERCQMPVYFYGEAALDPDRRELSEIRRGGIER